jgi:hypothetical protein
MTSKFKIITGIILLLLATGSISLWLFTQNKNPNEVVGMQNAIIEENPCAICINGCDTCPEGCDECQIGIWKKLKDPNLKWYYNPDVFSASQISLSTQKEYNMSYSTDRKALWEEMRENLEPDEDIWNVVWCLDTPNGCRKFAGKLCVEEETEGKPRLQIRNIYNGNKIQCSLIKGSLEEIDSYGKYINLPKDTFDKLKVDRIFFVGVKKLE